MNTKSKRRLIVVSGIIIVVAIIVLAIVGGNSAARTVTVAEARSMGTDTAKIQVTGNVIDNSFDIDGDTLTFEMYDPQADPAAASPLTVCYEGGVSATFGNEVTAICTGRMDPSGYLMCSELVTKCPSKYESAEGSLSIAELLDYGDSVIDKPVKIGGIIKDGTLAGIDAPERFVLADDASEHELRVAYQGALSDEMAEGSRVVLTGSLAADGSFAATVVALEE